MAAERSPRRARSAACSTRWTSTELWIARPFSLRRFASLARASPPTPHTSRPPQRRSRKLPEESGLEAPDSRSRGPHFSAREPSTKATASRTRFQGRGRSSLIAREGRKGCSPPGRPWKGNRQDRFRRRRRAHRRGSQELSPTRSGTHPLRRPWAHVHHHAAPIQRRRRDGPDARHLGAPRRRGNGQTRGMDALYAHPHRSCFFKHASRTTGAEWMADPAFVTVPTARLLSDAYLKERAARITITQTHGPETYGTREQVPDDGGTSHFCVVDSRGGAVSCTETINLLFGSLRRRARVRLCSQRPDGRLHHPPRRAQRFQPRPVRQEPPPLPAKPPP